MEIRRYKRGEESAIWKVYFDATRASCARDYHPVLIDRWAPLDKDMDEWRARLEQKNPFVAVVEGRIVGMAELDSNGFIDYFYVHPKSQRKGVGSALLDRLEAEAVERGLESVWGDVNVTAKTFFLSHGFCVTEARSKIILGYPAPNFRIEKRLGGEADGESRQ